jgi:hypothetical protein
MSWPTVLPSSPCSAISWTVRRPCRS